MKSLPLDRHSMMYLSIYNIHTHCVCVCVCVCFSVSAPALLPTAPSPPPPGVLVADDLLRGSSQLARIIFLVNLNSL